MNSVKKLQQEKGCRRIHSNILLQDCFLRDCVTAKDLNTHYEDKTYFELQRKTVDNGIREELVEVPYSITPQSVKSQAPFADYHSDVAGAIARGEKKQNLGDVSAIQKVMSMDSVEAQAYYQALKKRFEEAKVQPEPQPEPQAEPQPDGGDVK